MTDRHLSSYPVILKDLLISIRYAERYGENRVRKKTSLDVAFNLLL